MGINQVLNAAKTKLAGLSDLARKGAAAIPARWAPSRAGRWAPVIPAKVWLAAAVLLFAGLWLQEHDARLRRAAQLQQEQRQSAAEIAALRSKASAALEDANQRNARAIAALEAERAKLARRSQALSAQLESLQREEQARAQEIAALPPAQLASRLTTELGPSSVVPSSSQPAKDGAPLTLSVQGERRVVSALAERDACRHESAVRDQQLTNCRDLLAADASEIEKQADSAAKLNLALGAKDQILKRRETQFQAELQAARGTWHSRAVRALKLVGIGVAIGVAIR
jgi:hypothetical protein